MKQEKRSLREEIERKDGEIQELRAENELLKIENTTTELGLRKFSLSRVSLLGSMCKKVAIKCQLVITVITTHKIAR